MRQRLGQHFLTDTRLCERIVTELFEIIKSTISENLLEIGPGKGALTLPILSRVSEIKTFTVVEKDYDLSDHWFHEAKKTLNMKLVAGDFLEIAEDTWLTDSLCVISNLPYSAGTAILNRLAAHPRHIRGMVLMFQQEVAERLKASPGTKEWGSLSIWIQNQWEVTSVQVVSRGSFTPPPKVTSEVLKLIPRKEPLIPISDNVLWEKLLKASFAHRRKMLRSGLSGHPIFKKALESAGIDPTKRAEALNWDEWKSFYKEAVSCAK